MTDINVDGRSISKMTLGTVQLGLDYGIANKTGKPSSQKAFEILDCAVEGGISSYDTASAYGNAEEVIGNYICANKHKAERLFITTKFRIDPLKGTGKKLIEKQIYESVEKSLERLGLKKIPLYLLHNAGDMLQYGNPIIDSLKRLKDEGLIEKAGVSVYRVEEVEEMLKSDFYEAVQLPMNVFDLRMQKSGILKKLKDAGCIVFVRSVFLQGLFFMNPEDMPSGFTNATASLKQLHRLAEQEGVNVAQLALSYIRDLEGVTSLVLGAETREQVEENIKLIDSPRLTGNTASEVEKLSSEVPIEAIMNQILKKK